MKVDLKKLRKDFGKKVQIERIKNDISQEELAYRAEIHRTTLGAIENGKTPPNIETAAKIAAALNITLSRLFDFDFY
jgi:DNA-binding XRE family transcriptional regulator